MTETEIINRKIRPYLQEKYQARVVKIHSSPFSEAGVADLLCCIQKLFTALEVKKRGNKPTPIQLAFLESIRRAGGIAGVIYTDTYKQDIDNLLMPLSQEQAKDLAKIAEYVRLTGDKDSNFLKNLLNQAGISLSDVDKFILDKGSK